ncbi:UvrD-helicase domain-containing protein [Actinophytocola sp. NPDC049390]|uniref:UvrD-helicase domain-containing protein n=1 Tax=Actinophytocola sp. NPDC049390 TaxID=3363894 RepID=UPI00378ABB94
MIIADETLVTLTAAQRSVVELPWHAKSLVTAGAGAGKTTTLVHRLEYLMRNEEIEAAEVLVLSFSRTAVRELRDRLDRTSTSARRIRAQTFDSWASSVLYEEDPQRTDLVGVGYDQRVEMATQAIARGVIEDSERGAPRHVIVDEVQDLVGVRRDMIEALLDQFVEAGFTVVGDVAQSIYGFQIDDLEDRAGETARFLDWVRTSFADDLVELSLNDNFRARTAEARTALRMGPRLQSMRADDEAVDLYRELHALLMSMAPFGSLDDLFVQDSLRDYMGTTGILCQDNGQVLHLSRELDRLMIPYRIRRSPRERSSPAWLAALLSAVPVGRITEERFDSAVAGLDPGSERPPAWTWRSLRRVAGAPRNQLDLSALRRVIAERRIPDDLAAPPGHPLVLSTVHRAKGTEFDRVIVVEPDDPCVRHGRSDLQADVRLLYVAMTRPRDDLYRMVRPNNWIYRLGKHLPMPVDRWYTTGSRQWMRTGIEITEFDVAQDRPAESVAHVPTARELQEHLRDHVREGDQVDLRKLHDLPMSAEESPEYGVFRGDIRIGDVSERFRRDLRRVLARRRNAPVDRWPYAITGVRVEGVETIAGTLGTGRLAGLGDSDTWLTPRLCGMGRIEWSEDDSMEGPIDS